MFLNNFRIMGTRHIICVVIALIIIMTKCQTGAPWQSLFDGKTLTGWHRMNGNAEYKVENGVIVGISTPETPNSFLCTDSMYSNFILELDVKIDTLLNSGIQIRSNAYPEYRNNRVHGYQIEIDPTDRAWSGGIYDEARRGWLCPLTGNKEAGAAFNRHGWNHYRIEAIKDTIKTWINGVPAANLVDEMTGKGFIALQVHAIGEDMEKAGRAIRWKNIRIITETPCQYSKKSALPPRDMHNKLTSNEKKDGWKLLFDGVTSASWRGAKLKKFPEKGWEIKDNVLTVLASGGGESEHGGDIVTWKKYKNFELKVSFKITEGANSGIKYYVDTQLNKGKGSAIGPEYQILDDARHPDAKLGNHEGSRTLASLYDLIKAENKYPNPVGRWNYARIISKEMHVEHWLNDRKVLEYTRGSKEFRKLVSESKYVKWPNFGEKEKGHILLQDHGDRVSFRDIKIKVLD